MGFSKQFVVREKHLDLNQDGKIDLQDVEAAGKVKQQFSSSSLSNQSFTGDRVERDQQRWKFVQQAAQSESIAPLPTLQEQRNLHNLAGFLERLIKVRLAAAKQDTLAKPEADEVRNLDLSPLLAAGVQPVFLTDLDHTAWGVGIPTAVATYMIDDAANRVRPEAKAPMLDILLAAAANKPEKVADHLGMKVDKLEEQMREWVNNEDAGNIALQIHRMYKRWLLPNNISNTSYWEAFLAGYSKDELKQIAQKLYYQGVSRRKIAPVKDCLYQNQADIYQNLVNAGANGIAITAGVDVFAREMVRLFGLPLERVEGTQLVYDENGRATGYVKRANSTIKDNIALEVMNQYNGLVIAMYGDSPNSDTPMAMLADLVDRQLDPTENHVQNALRPELKATERRTLESLQKQLQAFHRKHVPVHIEANEKPATQVDQRHLKKR